MASMSSIMRNTQKAFSGNSSTTICREYIKMFVIHAKRSLSLPRFSPREIKDYSSALVLNSLCCRRQEALDDSKFSPSFAYPAHQPSSWSF